MADKGNGSGAGLGAGALEHGFGEINGGDARAGGSPSERMAARAAADVRHRQPGQVASQRADVLLLQRNQRVVLVVVELGPAVIAGLGRHDVHADGFRACGALLSYTLHTPFSLIGRQTSSACRAQMCGHSSGGRASPRALTSKDVWARGDARPPGLGI